MPMTISRARMAGAAAFLGAGALVAYLIAAASSDPENGRWAYVVATVAVFAAVFVLGEGRAFSLLRSDLGRTSMSQLQMWAWFVVLAGGALGLAMVNGARGSDFTSFEIPEEVLVLAGLAVGNAGVSRLARTIATSTAKMDDAGADAEDEAADDAENDAADDDAADAAGNDAAGVSAPDVLTVDGGSGRGDPSKVQLLVITAIVIGAYVAEMFHQFGVAELVADGAGKMVPNPDGTVMGFPALSDGLVGLLAVSHGGYLVYKGAQGSNQ